MLTIALAKRDYLSTSISEKYRFFSDIIFRYEARIAYERIVKINNMLASSINCGFMLICSVNEEDRVLFQSVSEIPSISLIS